MSKTSIPDPELDNLLKRTLKDDLPPEAEARMQRQFARLKHTLDRQERSPEPEVWPWMRGPFRREILALVSAAMIILGLAMQLSGTQSALAHTIEQLKVLATISVGLNRASSMDCTFLIPDAKGGQTSYRIRWRAAGDVRVDMDAADGARKLWISNNIISIAEPGDDAVHSMPVNTLTPGSVWHPALEFLSPELMAKHMERRYGRMQIDGRNGAATNEFLMVGREGQQDIEITVDALSYLPSALKKYALDSGAMNGERSSMMEARFFWNQPIPSDLFVPRPLTEKQ